MKLFLVLLLVAAVAAVPHCPHGDCDCKCPCHRELKLKEHSDNQVRAVLKSLRTIDDEAIVNFCANLENGNYAHPTGCEKYVACTNHIAYTMPCPAGLHFNHVLNKCLEPEEAHCLMFAGETTFAAKGRKPGRVSLAHLPSGLISQVRLEHVSGSVTCTQNVAPSYWGCNNNQATYTSEIIGTLITDAVETKIFEKERLPGFTGNSPFITFNSAVMDIPAVHTSELTDLELLVWYNEDFNQETTSDDSGEHVIKVLVTMDTDVDLELATRQSEQKTKTVQEEIPMNEECVGRADGNYIHPYECGLFLTCSNENTFVMKCPSGLHFNAKLNMCDYPEIVQCQVLVGQVTFAAKGNKPGVLKLDNTLNGEITQIRLDFVSGFVKCSTNSEPSKWGCNNSPSSNFPTERIGVQITNKLEQTLFKEDKMTGKTGNSKSITFNSNKNEISTGPIRIADLPEREIQVWYIEDMGNGDSEYDNSGEVTCKVYVSVL